jgi:hypothetical protein
MRAWHSRERRLRRRRRAQGWPARDRRRVGWGNLDGACRRWRRRRCEHRHARGGRGRRCAGRRRGGGDRHGFGRVAGSGRRQGQSRRRWAQGQGGWDAQRPGRRSRRRTRPLGGFSPGGGRGLPRRGPCSDAAASNLGVGRGRLVCICPIVHGQVPSAENRHLLLVPEGEKKAWTRHVPVRQARIRQIWEKPGVQPTTWRRSATCRGPFGPNA